MFVNNIRKLKGQVPDVQTAAILTRASQIYGIAGRPILDAAPTRNSRRSEPGTLQAAKAILNRLKARREKLTKDSVARREKLAKASGALQTSNLIEARYVLAGIKGRTAAAQSRHRRKLDGIVLTIAR